MRGEEEEREEDGGDYVVVHPFPMFAVGGHQQQEQLQQQQLGKAESQTVLNTVHNVSLDAGDCTVEVFLGKGEASVTVPVF
jgi:hypothetical protein